MATGTTSNHGVQEMDIFAERRAFLKEFKGDLGTLSKVPNGNGYPLHVKTTQQAKLVSIELQKSKYDFLDQGKDGQRFRTIAFTVEGDTIEALYMLPGHLKRRKPKVVPV